MANKKRKVNRSAGNGKFMSKEAAAAADPLTVVTETYTKPEEIINNFEMSDSIEQRIEKLNQQTGLNFELEISEYNTDQAKLNYNGIHGRKETATMEMHELLRWSATFALGFRSCHNKGL